MLVFLILFVFAFSFIMTGCCIFCGEKFKDNVLPVFVVAILISLIGFLPTTTPPFSYVHPILPSGEYEIQVIHDTSVIYGETYLLSGNIQEKAVYVCYIKIEYEDYANAYEQMTFPTFCSVIIEEKISKPYIKVVTEVIPRDLWRIISYESVKNYEFHVPPNSIKPMVNLDLEK